MRDSGRSRVQPELPVETGYAFGRYPAHTILVEIGRMDLFPISLAACGALPGAPVERTTLKTRLATAGCALDDRGNDWLESGDFATALE